MQLSDKLIKLLDERRISARELAEAINVSHTATQKIVNGDTDEPGYRKVYAIARHLQVPIDWLVDDRTEWPPPRVKVFEELPSFLDLFDHSDAYQDLCQRRGGEVAVLAAGFMMLSQSERGLALLRDLPPEATQAARDACQRWATDLMFSTVQIANLPTQVPAAAVEDSIDLDRGGHQPVGKISPGVSNRSGGRAAKDNDKQSEGRRT